MDTSAECCRSAAWLFVSRAAALAGARAILPA